MKKESDSSVAHQVLRTRGTKYLIILLVKLMWR